MTNTAHVDFESVGHVDVTTDRGTYWQDTGIALPESGVEALAVRVFNIVTGFWDEARLRDTAAVEAGTIRTGSDGLPLSELGDTTFGGGRIGHSAATDDAPHGTLMVAHGGTGRVELWHGRPTGIGLDDLSAALRELVEDGGGGEDAPTGTVYATIAQYQERQTVPGQTPPVLDAGDTAVLQAQLAAVSRYVDQRLRVAPGHFAPIATATYVFRGRRGSVLRLRDEEANTYALRALSGAGITATYRDGTTRTWAALGESLQPRPLNAVALGRPIHALQLTDVYWPDDAGTVSIEGAWGWAAVPGPILELVVGLTRDWRDAQRGGAAATITNIDGVPLSNDSARMWAMVEAQYRQGHASIR